MKKIQYIIVALFLLQINSAEAQTQTVNIKAPGFVRPLVERWIAEYQKINSDLSFQLGQKKDNAIIFVLEEREERKEERGETVFFGRYAIVPFTGKDSEAAALIAKKKLNDKRIKNLLFEKDDLSEEKSDKLEGKLHIYTGAQSFSVALPYAAAYGLTAADYRGKRIQGDDRFLNKAVGEDAWELGISALGNLYDLQSRHLKDQLQVASLDDSKKIDLTASLDEVLEALETHTVEGIDVEKIGFAFDVNNLQLNRFVNWVLTDGQQYLHEYGLLTLSQKDLISQQRSLHHQDIARR
jgi:hypothetical protein